MTLLKELKSKGVDLFIQYHPRVQELKRKAKSIHKELKNKSKPLSLMQSQELVAKQCGFNNWHHFIQLIRNQYGQELENNPFPITQQAVHNHHHILLGKDINFNHYKWSNDAILRSHQLILGDFNEQYDMFLAKQAIRLKKEVFIFNFNENDVKELIQTACNCQRQKDIRVFNLSNHNLYEEYEKGLSINLKNDCIFFIEENINKIYDELKLEKNNELIILAKKIIFDELQNQYYFISDDIKILFKKTITSIKELNNNFQEYQIILINVLTMIQKQMLEICETSSVFSKNGIRVENFLNSNIGSPPINVFILPQEKSNLHKALCLSYIKNLLWKQLGSPIDNKYLDILPNVHKEIKFIFFREMGNKIMGITSAQARSLKISLTLSYPSMSSMKDNMSDEEIEIILANTKTKILSVEEKQIVQEKYEQNSQNNAETLINNMSLFNIINEKSVVWLCQKDKEYQISFM